MTTCPNCGATWPEYHMPADGGAALCDVCGESDQCYSCDSADDVRRVVTLDGDGPMPLCSSCRSHQDAVRRAL